MGKFLLRKVASGMKFDLKAGNGETIGTSEVYSSLASAKHGIESVRKNAVAEVEDQTNGETIKNPKFELYTDKSGEYRFRLKASNGEIILVSEGYKSKSNAMNGIKSVKSNAPDAVVVEE